MATVKPSPKPNNVQSTFVPSQLSIHTPATPGNTISSEIVVICDTQAMAVAMGERSFSPSLAMPPVQAAIKPRPKTANPFVG
jgi:hypothetical protein